MQTLNNTGFRICVYGGQFGSEGKGCVAEHLISNYHDLTRRLVVFGENAPNSGHNNSMGKTQSLPVSAYFADAVLLGPDSAIDPELLMRELKAIRLHRPNLVAYVHENAAMIERNAAEMEKADDLAARVASTTTGGGWARTRKAFHRDVNLTMRGASHLTGFEVVDRTRWFELLVGFEQDDWLFECSQGMMLDTNLGYYPCVTSRTTHPRAAIERNGLGPSAQWSFAGTFRTYPIRTGGNSGPTGGKELTWEQVGVKPEIAVVTKRVRRVFEFSAADFLYSVGLVRPDIIAFTHLDYLPEAWRGNYGFIEWLSKSSGLGRGMRSHPYFTNACFLTSQAPSMFTYLGTIFAGPVIRHDLSPFEIPAEQTIKLRGIL